MIETTRDRYIIHCDQCADVEEIETAEVDGWRGMIEEIKALGWRIFKEGADWHHDCPSCAEERRHER